MGSADEEGALSDENSTQDEEFEPQEGSPQGESSYGDLSPTFETYISNEYIVKPPRLPSTDSVLAERSTDVNRANIQAFCPYEAISYVWGPPIFDHTLEILDFGSLQITESLFVALRHLRSTQHIRRLWADAVCINQLDNHEKSGQVARMMEIYAKASKVLVWLGPEAHGDVLAFGILNACEILPYKDSLDIEPLKGIALLEQDFRSSNFALPRPATAVDALFTAFKLFQKPWWSRLWTVQEVTSHQGGRNVLLICGRLQTHWTYFSSVSLLLVAGVHEGLVQWPSNSWCSETKFREKTENLLELFLRIDRAWKVESVIDRIVRCTSRICSVPHDRIYACYSWLELWRLPDVAPDYDHSATEVYRRITIAVFLHSQAARSKSTVISSILALIGTEGIEASQDDRPSWVPHYHYLTDRSRAKHELYASNIYQRYAQFDPGVSGRLICKNDINTPGLISLAGTCFATVGRVAQHLTWSSLQAPHCRTNDLLIDSLEWYLKCKAFINDTLAVNHVDPIDLCAIFRCGFSAAPIADSLQAMQAVKARILHATEISVNVLQISMADMEMSEYGIIGMIYDIVDERIRDAQGHYVSRFVDRDRRLSSVVTEAGSNDIAWVPATAKEGDRLCVFSGSPYPFLVRNVGTERYMMLGDAWTSRTTLVEALGGTHDCPQPEECRRQTSSPRCNSWASRDESLQKLSNSMGWIDLE